LLHSIVIHCADRLAQARFWTVATGMPPYGEDKAYLDGERPLPDDENIALDDGRLRIWLSRADEVPPPGGRLHLDLDGDETFADRLVALGASVVRRDHERTVLRDPEGNEFCVEYRSAFAPAPE
jgi:Glyoxalase-like domain